MKIEMTIILEDETDLQKINTGNKQTDNGLRNLQQEIGIKAYTLLMQEVINVMLKTSLIQNAYIENVEVIENEQETQKSISAE
jgi:hypothetical protein